MTLRDWLMAQDWYRSVAEAGDFDRAMLEAFMQGRRSTRDGDDIPDDVVESIREIEGDS